MVLLRVSATAAAVTETALNARLKGKSASANKRHGTSDLCVAIGRAANLEEVLAIVESAGYRITDMRQSSSGVPIAPRRQPRKLPTAVAYPTSTYTVALRSGKRGGAINRIGTGDPHVKPALIRRQKTTPWARLGAKVTSLLTTMRRPRA